jgi:hypothetical protein
LNKYIERERERFIVLEINNKIKYLLFIFFYFIKYEVLIL